MQLKYHFPERILLKSIEIGPPLQELHTKNTFTPEPLSQIVSCLCSGVEASATVFFSVVTLSLIAHGCPYQAHMGLGRGRYLGGLHSGTIQFIKTKVSEWRCFVV